MPDSSPHSISVSEVAEMAYAHAKKAWWANARTDLGEPLGDYPAQAFNEGLEELKAAFASIVEQLAIAETERDDFEASQARLLEQFDAAMDCMNYAWTIICNVSEGDWTKQQQEWQDAAARCRDQYHALLDSNPASVPEGLGQTTAPRAGERPAASFQDRSAE